MGFGCDKIYRDKYVNRNDYRDGLRRMLKRTKKGDIIFVHRNEVIFASMNEMVRILSILRDKNAHYISLSDFHFNTLRLNGSFLLKVFDSIRRFQNDILLEKRNHIKRPKQRTLLMGRPSGIQNATLDKYEYANFLYEVKKETIETACQKAQLSKSSYYRINSVFKTENYKT
ncbi:hypothetical protein MTsPCn5_16880 [Croceitalea sp. MTPC5]|nr:hypothetical protein MTsPCn5_16880 [Croceitalea sp. MTPC5]